MQLRGLEKIEKKFSDKQVQYLDREKVWENPISILSDQQRFVNLRKWNVWLLVGLGQWTLGKC